jgi:hypothetical protein
MLLILILKGSAPVDMLRQSLEVSLQNIHSINHMVRNNTKRNSHNTPMISLQDLQDLAEVRTAWLKPTP